MSRLPSALAAARENAREDISAWSSADVVQLLKKNGVEEACWKAAEKRQIDGDELLHLTEGKLALWKSDLTRPLIWSLWTFVEELKKSPEKYVEQRKQQQQQQQQQQQEQPQEQQTLQLQTQAQVENCGGALSDASSWDTDFDDDEDDADEEPESTRPAPRVNSDFRNSLRIFQENDRAHALQQSAELRSSTLTLGSNRRASGASSPGKQASPSPENCSYYANSTATTNGHSSLASAVSESIYANCPEPENTYVNARELHRPREPQRNTSRLHSPSIAELQQQTGLAEKLREQLALLGVKPNVVPKPESLLAGKREAGQPRTSFLHKRANKAPSNGHARNITAAEGNGVASKEATELTNATNPNNYNNNHSSTNNRTQSSSEESLRNLPKPPASIRGFDLVANLPPTTHSSAYETDDEENDEEDEEDVELVRNGTPERNLQQQQQQLDTEEESYESFDQEIVEQHRRAADAASGRSSSASSSLAPRHNSAESVYRPPSIVAFNVDQPDDEIYDLYESITESLEDDKYAKNEDKTKGSKIPPPLPAKPPRNLSASQNHLNKEDSRTERSLERRSAVLSSPNGSPATSPIAGATRPLPPPPPPERQSYYDRPWFHNLTREQANRLIEDRCARGSNPLDGYFLLRPSVSNPDNPMTLVLWYKDKVYNIPVRRRPDNRYALGTPKDKERSFESIDDIVPFFKTEELVLSSGGVETGKTRLTETPPKQ